MPSNKSYSLSENAAGPLISLDDLRLDDARALLEHHLLAPPAQQGHSQTAYLQNIINSLCELSLKDPLTGIANRRQFHSVLSREIDAVARSGDHALLLLLDLDHFKQINDAHGHPAGDLVLQAVARCLSSCVRPMDTVARYGGEEFAVVLPSCQVAYGLTVAERIRKAVAALAIPVTPQLNLHVTISIGGAFAHEWVRSTTELWTERADTQLYLAKSQGRNRVFIDEQQVMAVSAEEKNMLFGHLSLGEPAWIETTPPQRPVNPAAPH